MDIFNSPPLNELMLKVDHRLVFLVKELPFRLLYYVFVVHRAILFHKSAGLLQNKYLKLGVCFSSSSKIQ